jgi:hypothetical protein
VFDYSNTASAQATGKRKGYGKDIGREILELLGRGFVAVYV